MTHEPKKHIDVHVSGRSFAEESRDFSHRILDYARSAVPGIKFRREVTRMLMDFSGCDAVELRLVEDDKCFCYEFTGHPEEAFRFEIVQCTRNKAGEFVPCLQDESVLERLCGDVFNGHFDSALPFFTKNGSFWTGDTMKPLVFPSETVGSSSVHGLRIGGDYRSLVMIPLVVGNENTGALILKSKKKFYFTRREMEFYEDVAQTLAIAMAHRRAQAAYRERVKELTCLYGMAQLAAQPGISLGEILRGIVMLIPPAWQYPEITCGKIVLDGRSYVTPGFRDRKQSQTADIVVDGQHRGSIEVIYLEKRPELDEGPFLKEERNLIDTLAKQVALIIQQKQAAEEKSRLHEQLRHADRLATIGQLSAGVAHELNEPLGNILGFAQLAKKYQGLPQQVKQDLDKIVNASLHAREVIRKLMLFARQMPLKKTSVDLNQVVKEGLYFLESRCAKEGIELVRSLSPNLPEITADPAQLHQVLVNLVVNAIQAMPKGGRLTLETRSDDDYVILIVEDTGVGMSDEVKTQIFIPFFTTKDVGQGTGIGLSVVHGIVTSHGGTIDVDSEVGSGSRFELHLPISGVRDEEKAD